jgi:hypothetical protein
VISIIIRIIRNILTLPPFLHAPQLPPIWLLIFQSEFMRPCSSLLSLPRRITDFSRIVVDNTNGPRMSLERIDLSRSSSYTRQRVLHASQDHARSTAYAAQTQKESPKQCHMVTSVAVCSIERKQIAALDLQEPAYPHPLICRPLEGN